MDVEFPLIEAELSAIDVKLQAAETTLFWNSEGARAGAGAASPRAELGQNSGVCPVSLLGAASAFPLGGPLCPPRGWGHGCH